ncbi:MAG TPA: Asp-tRNA(Asn)/Glu-tRNA(Gln) amidotransferase subunit GatC [Candidatus Paceibacterota bacterium]|nr:Asp-tRNA(Asn)/Glu-tRNA(Gln) amidotransferase subunit GatC [Candidatus Paceibacterota bacterium]
MANATPEDVVRLAGLARVEVPEADLPRFAREFDAVLAYVGKLDELVIPDLERTVPPVRNVFRADLVTNETGSHTEKLVAQFPQREGDSLSVKQIISHD